MKPMTPVARKLRRNATEGESRLWRALRNSRLSVRIRRQYPIGQHVADFAILSIGLVIEVDGGQHDLTRGADERRTRALEARGYRVIRFWNNEVMENLEGVVESIQAEIARSSPSLPLHAKRGEGGTHASAWEGEDG